MVKKAHISNILKYGVLLGLFAVVSVFALILVSRSNTFLWNNIAWKVEAADYFKPPVHIFPNMVSSVAFKSGGFTTGTWGGFTSVVTRDTFYGNRLVVKAAIGKGGWLAVLLRGKKDFAAGMVVGGGRRGAEFVCVDRDGGFKRKEAMDAFDVETDAKVQQFELELDGADGLKLSVDGEEQIFNAECVQKIIESGFKIAIRAGGVKNRVLSVKLVNDDKTVFFTNFYKWHVGLFVPCCLVVLLLAIVLLFYVKKQTAYKTALLVLCGGVLVLGAYRIADSYFLAHWEPVGDHYDTGQDFVLKNAEKNRFNGLGDLHTKMLEKADKDMILKQAVKECKQAGNENIVLCLGSWSAWGEGSRSAGGSFFDICEADLCLAFDDVNGKKERFSFINAAFPGMNSTDAVDVYQSLFARFKPRFCLVVLGAFFDPVPPVFYNDLVRLAKLAKDSQTVLVFVLESGAKESFPDGVEHNRYMIKAAADAGVELINLHGALQDSDLEGFCWEAPFCLSPFGHKVAGRCIASELLKIIQKSGVIEGSTRQAERETYL